MTLTFNKEVVNDAPISVDSFRNCNFIGYLNPYGEDIDYSLPFGLGGHDNNPITNLFLKYFYLRESYNQDALFNTSLEDKIKDEKEMGIIRRENIEYYIEGLHAKIVSNKKNNMSFKWELLKYDLLTFLLNCYQNDSFVIGFGKKCTMMSEEEFEEKVFKYIKKERDHLYLREEDAPPYYTLWYAYDTYLTKLKLDKFKDVMIQYMGYHYIARTPRTIYTSEPNIYETFYNYILNDFTIYQLPKMIYNSDEKKYIERKNEIFKPEREDILKQETESIKRMVKREYRYKYYM